MTIGKCSLMRRMGGHRDTSCYTTSKSTQVEASGWRKHEGAVAGVDYSSQLPAGWAGGSSGPDRGARGISSSSTSDHERYRAWKVFERRPISRAEAKALREVRISRGIRNRTPGSGAGSTGGGESAQDYSSSCSASTSLGTTEDNISLLSSVADNSSDMPIATVPSSLGRAIREKEVRSEKSWMPTDGDIENAINNIYVPSSTGGGQHKHLRRSKSEQGPSLSPCLGNVALRSRDYYSTAQHQQRRLKGGRIDGREKHKSGALQDRTSSGVAPKTTRTLNNGRDDDGDWSTASSAAVGTITPSNAPELRSDQKGGVPGDILNVGLRLRGVRSGGGGLSPMLNDSPPSEKASAATPSSGIDLNFSSESIFRLNSEADADGVMRAMVRLTSTPSLGTGKPGSRILSPADGIFGSICRGNTPGIKSGSRSGQTDFFGGSPLEGGETAFDVGGLTLQSTGGARSRQALFRQEEKRVVASDRGRVDDNKIDISGSRPTPIQGRRGNEPAAAAAGQSKSTPSKLSKAGSLESFVSLNSGGGEGHGGGAGGRNSVQSCVQTSTSAEFERNRPLRSSITVSSVSVTSQQKTISTSGNTVGDACGFDLNSESNVSNEITRGVASRSGIVTAGGKRGRPSRQNQQRPARTKAALAHEQSGTPSASGVRGGCKLFKDFSKSNISTGKTADGNGPSTRREKKKTIQSLWQDGSRALDESGDRARDDVIGSYDDGDDGDDKTTGEQMSAIIAGVTREAAESVASPGGISTANTPLIPEGLSGPSSSTQVPQRSPPPATERVHLTQPSGVVRISMTGRNTSENISIDHRNNPTANVHEIRRNTETVEGREIGAFSSTVLDGASPRLSPTLGRSSSHYLKQAEGGNTTTGRNGAAETLALPGITDSITIAEPLALTSSSGGGGCSGGGREEDGPEDVSGASRAGGAVVSTKGEPGRAVTAAAGGPTSPEAFASRAIAPGRNSGARTTEKQENTGKSRGDAIVPEKGKGLSNRSSRSVGGKVMETEAGSPSSSVSTVSSRKSNRSGNSSVRGSRSTKPGKQRLDTEKSSSTARKGARTEELKTRNGDTAAPSTEASLPLLVQQRETAAVSGGVQRDPQQHTPAGEEIQGGRAGDGSEIARTKQLPRVIGAAGGRRKASVAAGKTAKQAMKVHSRPERVESQDLGITTEALITHHISMDDLLKVQLNSRPGRYLTPYCFRVHGTAALK